MDSPRLTNLTGLNQSLAGAARLLPLLAALVLLAAAAPAQTTNSPVAAAPEPPPELTAIRAKFRKPLKKVHIEYSLHLRGARRSYLGILGQMAAEQRYSGDLDGAEITDAERERVARGETPTAEQRRQLSGRLGDVRARYDQSLAGANLKRRREEAKVQIMYLREINRLEKRLVVRGDLATAQVIEVERQRVRRSLAEFVAELTLSGLE